MRHGSGAGWQSLISQALLGCNPRSMLIQSRQLLVWWRSTKKPSFFDSGGRDLPKSPPFWLRWRRGRVESVGFSDFYKNLKWEVFYFLGRGFAYSDKAKVENREPGGVSDKYTTPSLRREATPRFISVAELMYFKKLHHNPESAVARGCLGIQET